MAHADTELICFKLKRILLSLYTNIWWTTTVYIYQYHDAPFMRPASCKSQNVPALIKNPFDTYIQVQYELFQTNFAQSYWAIWLPTHKWNYFCLMDIQCQHKQYHIFNDTSDLHFKDTLHKCLKVHVFYFSVECWIGPWVYMYVCIHFVSKHYIRQFVYTPQAASHHIYTELGHGHINMQLRTVEKISVLCILILSVYAKRLYCNIFS